MDGPGEVANEVLGSIRTVRSFAMEVKESNRYGHCIDTSYHHGMKRYANACGEGFGVGRSCVHVFPLSYNGYSHMCVSYSTFVDATHIVFYYKYSYLVFACL